MRFMNIAARLCFAALLLSIAIGMIAGFGTRFRLWDYQIGLLRIFPLCLYAGVVAVGLGLAWMLTAVLSGSGAGARYAVIGLLGSIAVLCVPLHDLYLERIAHAVPPIHDISTDTEHAPAFVTLSGRRPGATNGPGYDGPTRVEFEGRSYTTETLQKLFYGDIKSDSLLGITPAKLFHRAVAAAQAMGWKVVAITPDTEGGRIEATDTTLLFGLTDDIVIRVRPAGIGARVDVRSKSRVGVNDEGRNAARIRAYLKQLART